MQRLLLGPVYAIRLLLQSVVLALEQIWANKLRSLLTAIGIVIGVASVSAVIATLAGLQSSVLEEFESLGTNKLFIVPRMPDVGSGQGVSPRRIRFTPELTEGLAEHAPAISQVTRVTQFRATARHAERAVDGVPVTGIEPNWHEIENRVIRYGRAISLLDDQQRRNVCLINTELRDELRLDRDPSGQQIHLDNRLYQIVGVIDTRVENPMFDFGETGAEAFIPFATAWHQREPWISVIATASSTDRADEARAQARFYLRNRRGLRPGEPDNFEIHVVEQYLEQFNRIATAVMMVAAGIVGISLLVGGVGIMNIMLASVSERTREIGLRKAVGARPAAIMLQFLIEAVVLCLVGGFLGLAAGHLLAQSIAAIPGANLEHAHVPAWAVLLAFAFSVVVGLIFGFLPAVKAARLDPIDALRHE